MSAFEEFMKGIPLTWTCVRCDKEFPNSPNSPMPYGVSVVVDKDTGLRRMGGDICTSCFGRSARSPSTNEGE